MTSIDPLADLAEAGVAVRLDDLSRARLRSGNLAELVRRGIVGVTTNPTIRRWARAPATRSRCATSPCAASRRGR